MTSLSGAQEGWDAGQSQEGREGPGRETSVSLAVQVHLGGIWRVGSEGTPEAATWHVCNLSLMGNPLGQVQTRDRR